MSRELPPGAVFWIDHYVVPTNDLPKSLDFIKNILGGVFYHQLPIKSADVPKDKLALRLVGGGRKTTMLFILSAAIRWTAI